MAADAVAEQVQRRLDRDRVRLNLQQLVRRIELAVDRARPFGVAVQICAHLLGDLRPDDVRVHADAADPPELEEGIDQVVVARVEIEIGVRDDVRCLVEVVVRLLDRAHRRICASRVIVSGSMLITTRDGML